MTMKLKTLFRSASEIAVDENKESRSITFSFSSEAPVARWFGTEILDHSAASVDLSRLATGAPLLLDHDPARVIGVIERAWLDNKRGYVSARFSRSAQAEEVFNDVKDGIRRNVSVGYSISKLKEEKADGENSKTFRAIGWQPMEVSIVGVPADQSVGIGRAAGDEYEPEILALEKEEPATEKRNAEKIESKIQVLAEHKEKDERKMSEDILKNERSRIAEIESVATQFPEMRSEVKNAIDSGMSIADFKAATLVKVGMRKPESVKDANIGMSEKEKGEYSILRAINAEVNKDWTGAGLEREASKACEKLYGRSSKGFFIPHDVLSMKRTNQSTTSNYGGQLVQTDVLGTSFIDILRNRLVLVQAGARMLTGLTGNVSIPKKTSGSTAYWVTEGSSLTSSYMGTSALSLSPKTVGAYVPVTKQLLSQSSVDAEMLVRTDMLDGIAVAIDLAGINGKTSLNQPKGILNSSLVNSITVNARPTFAKVVDFETEVGNDNALNGNLTYVTNQKVVGRCKQTLQSSLIGARWLMEDGKLNSYPVLISNQLPRNLGATSNRSAMIFGDFSQVIIAMWGGLDITVDPYTLAQTGVVRMIVHQLCDIGIRQPGAFAKATDIVTT